MQIFKPATCNQLIFQVIGQPTPNFVTTISNSRYFNYPFKIYFLNLWCPTYKIGVLYMTLLLLELSKNERVREFRAKK